MTGTEARSQTVNTTTGPATGTPNVSTQSTAVYYDLGPEGIIVHLSIGERSDSQNSAKQPDNLRTLVVLDISGSMGNLVEWIVNTILPQVLRSLNVREEEKITLITFESVTECSNLTISELERCPLRARGGTKFSPAITMVGKILQENPTTPFRIVVFSDGDVSDKQHCLNIAATLEGKLNEAGRTAPIQLCLIRAMSSDYASPDTAALACIGQLNTGGDAAPKDCNMAKRTQEQKEEVITAILDSFGECKGKIREIGCGNAPVLMRLPESQGQTAIQVFETNCFVMLAPGADPSQLTVDEEKVVVTSAKLSEEDAILPLLLFLESQVRQMMVIGTATVRVKQLLDWVGRISSRVFKEEKIEESPSVIARRHKLLQKISTKRKSVVFRLRQLANVTAVSSLNSARQAEFLRGVGAGNQGKALARRAAKIDSSDINEVVRAELIALRNKVVATPLKENHKTDLVSFYGHDTLPGMLNSLKDVDENDIYELDAPEIMQFVGPLGFSFYTKRQSDAPDPWNCFQLNQIFLGDSTYLNSADLWTSRVQSGQGASSTLFAPGTSTQITGVIPVRHLAPEAFDLLRTTAPTLLNLHVAASLRGSLVCMPGDLQAMLSAAAVHLATTLSSKPTEAGAVALYSILQDLSVHKKKKTLGITTEMARFFSEKDPRPYLAGDLFIASGLKPLAAIITGTVERSPALCRAILGFSLYIAAGKKYSSPQERKQALEAILSISEKNDITPGAPGTPDPINPTFSRDFSIAVLRQLDGLSPEHGVNEITASVLAAKAFKESGEDGNIEKFLTTFKKCQSETISVFGTTSAEETEDIVAALAVQAIRSPNQESRIAIDATNPKIRTYRRPDVTNSAEALQYVGDEVSEIYAERYKQLLKVKRDEEEAERCRDLIKALIAIPSVDEFLKLLTEPAPEINAPMIKDRSSPGYAKLIEALLQSPEKEGEQERIPERLMKIWVLLLGRDKSGGVVWCQGNSLRGDYKPYFNIFAARGDAGRELWKQLNEVREQFGLHRYRESGLPNRYGHSNEFLSWWARGYSSPDQFKLGDPEGFKLYCAERRKRSYHVPSWMYKM